MLNIHIISYQTHCRSMRTDPKLPLSPPVPPRFETQWLSDLRTAPAAIDWLWDGYLAAGNVTLLTSPWKAGKTTLIALLLARMKAGGVLGGQAVRSGRVVVVSEESRTQWLRRAEKLHLEDHVCWLCRPFRRRPTPDDWLGLLDHIAELHRRHGLDLLVIDPWASFLPGRAENDAATSLETLLPLQQLTTAGLAVLILHHPRKQASADGHWARGSSALLGFADVLLEMHTFSRASADDRRRTLLGYSRFEETPRRRVIELNAAGTDYVSLGDLEEEEFGRAWMLLRSVLTEAKQKLARDEILAAWPEHEEKPSEITLFRWLERAVAHGQVQRDGRGRKSEPFRYWLPEAAERWQQLPYGPAQMQADQDALRQLLGEGE
jgi:hypothetical protein